MIDLAMDFVGIGYQGKVDLMNYYNKNIYPLIDKNRKYKIQPNDNWCAMFCSVIAHKEGVNNFPHEVSVYYMVEKAKKMGIFSKDISNAKVNDLIIYDWKNDGTLNHVGILLRHGNNHFDVIEGNYRGTVGVRSIKIPNKEVYGVIHLNVSEKVDIDRLAREVIQGKHGSGEQRVKALGAHYNDVQKRVNQILK